MSASVRSASNLGSITRCASLSAACTAYAAGAEW